MTDPQRYEKHLDTVVALISNLALTTKEQHTMRSVSGLATDLGRHWRDGDSARKEIEDTLEAFPGFFRQSVSKNNIPIYALHLRWAQTLEGENSSPQILSGDLLKVLLEFVSKQAEAEAAENQFRETILTTRKQVMLARNGAWIAALAAVLACVATIISALIKGGLLIGMCGRRPWLTLIV